MITNFGFLSAILLVLPNKVYAFHSYGPPLPSAEANTLISYYVLNFAFGLYILALGLYAFFVLSGKSVLVSMGRYGSYVVYVAIVFHGLGYLLRWKELYDHGWGHFPLYSFYEAAILYCLILAIIAIYLQVRTKCEIIVAFYLPVIIVVLFLVNYTEYAGIQVINDNNVQEVGGAIFVYRLWMLKSICYITAYSSFTTSGIISTLLTVSKLLIRKISVASIQLPLESTLYSWNKKAILDGLALFIFGLFFGSYWSNLAWGTYWSWSSEQTSTVIVLFSYIYIVLMNTWQGWSSSNAKNRSIVGNAIIISTYFIANYLLRVI